MFGSPLQGAQAPFFHLPFLHGGMLDKTESSTRGVLLLRDAPAPPLLAGARAWLLGAKIPAARGFLREGRVLAVRKRLGLGCRPKP